MCCISWSRTTVHSLNRLNGALVHTSKRRLHVNWSMHVFRSAFVGVFLWLVAGSWVSVARAQVWELEAEQALFPTEHGYADAFRGGLNGVVFLNLDLNGDGLQDLVGLDKADNSVHPYLVDTAASEAYDFGSYTYAPQYIDSFPPLVSWVRGYDIEGDGDVDLLTFNSVNNNGVSVYRSQRAQTGQLAFTLDVQFLKSSYLGASSTVYSSRSDIVDVADIDGDGDMDILGFNLAGSRVVWYRNRSMQDFGLPDSLKFETVSDCWGHFDEFWDPSTQTYSANLFTGKCKLEQDALGKVAHSGGALSIIQLNNDTLWDIVIGDEEVPYLIGLTNGGTRTFAEITGVDTAFPDTAKPINLADMPVVSWVDVNADGKRDLIASPIDFATGRFNESVWLYLNEGQDLDPDFKFVTENFLQDRMYDPGAFSHGVFTDLNQDGLTDMLYGVGERYYTRQNRTSALRFLFNTGSTRNPSYSLDTTDAAGWQTSPVLQNARNLYLAAGNIGGDATPDIVAGLRLTTGSQLMLLADTTAVGNGPRYAVTDTNFLGLKGRFVNFQFVSEWYPALGDLDQDGDLDLAVGTDKGRILLFRNDGSASAPNFVEITDHWGFIPEAFPAQPGNPFQVYRQQRIALADVDGDDQLELLVCDGHVSYLPTGVKVYDNVSLSTTDTFALVDTWYPNEVTEDFRLAVLPQRIHADTLFLDAVVGGARGGLGLRRRILTAPDTATSAPEASSPLAFRISPNPATDWLNVHTEPGTSIEIRALTGQLMAHHVVQHRMLQFDVRAWPAGVYVLRAGTGSRQAYRRLVVAH